MRLAQDCRMFRGFVVSAALASLVACTTGGRSDTDMDAAPGQEATQESVVDGASPSAPSTPTSPPSSAITPRSTPTPEPVPTQEAEPVPADQLPFVTCSDEPVTISALDPASMETVDVAVDVDRYVCDGTSVSDVTLTESGRYIVSFDTRRYRQNSEARILDLETEREAVIRKTELDEWATSQSSSGLDARSRTMVLGGFDKNGDGRIFVCETTDANALSRDSCSENQPVFSLDVSEVSAANGLIEPTPLPDRRPCYMSRQWSTDGSLCLTSRPGSSVVYAVETDLIVETDSDWEDARIGFDPVSLSTDHSAWLDSSTIVGADLSIEHVRPYTVEDDSGGGEAEPIYVSSGDRHLFAWVNSRSESVYIMSPTLDGDAVEVYSVEPTPSAEPELLGTLPRTIRLIHN